MQTQARPCLMPPQLKVTRHKHSEAGEGVREEPGLLRRSSGIWARPPCTGIWNVRCCKVKTWCTAEAQVILKVDAVRKEQLPAERGLKGGRSSWLHPGPRSQPSATWMSSPPEALIGEQGWCTQGGCTDCVCQFTGKMAWGQGRGAFSCQGLLSSL